MRVKHWFTRNLRLTKGIRPKQIRAVLYVSNMGSTWERTPTDTSQRFCLEKKQTPSNKSPARQTWALPGKMTLVNTVKAIRLKPRFYLGKRPQLITSWFYRTVANLRKQLSKPLKTCLDGRTYLLVNAGLNWKSKAPQDKLGELQYYCTVVAQAGFKQYVIPLDTSLDEVPFRTIRLKLK